MRDPSISSQLTLTHMTRRRAELTPDALALVTHERNWTFGDLHAESNRLAQGLRRLGLGPGDRIGCYTKQSVECLVSLLAAAKIGAACAVFNWRLTTPELEYVVNQSEARFMLTDRALLPQYNRISKPRVQWLRLTDGPVLASGDGPSTGYAPVSGDASASSLAAAGGEDPEQSLVAWRSAQPNIDTGYEPSPHDTVLQLNSSGTTGLPKSVELSHRGLITQCDRIGPLFGYTSVEHFVMLNALPNFHVSGMVNMIMAMFEGGVSVCYSEFDPPTIVKAFARHGITHTFLVPAMIQFLLEVPDVAQADFSSLKAINYGGSPISESLLVRAMQVFGCDFYQVYGMTEISGSFSILPPHEHDPGGPRSHLLRSAGRIADGFRGKVVDPASGRELAEGETGEIWAFTNTLMNGYFRNPQATQAAVPEPRTEVGSWYRTGDAGCIRDGYLYIQDRVKDMIISGGENIYPAEIENALQAHPDLLEVAVIGVPDERWGESVKACVVVRSGRSVKPEALIAFCRDRLAGYKCPKSVDFVDSLPRNPSGKLLKRLLREPYWAGQDRNVA